MLLILSGTLMLLRMRLTTRVQCYIASVQYLSDIHVQSYTLNAMYNVCHDVPGGKLKINDTKTKYLSTYYR